MSKAIRIKDHLYAEIDRLAKAERRSLIGQLEFLLEQALNLPDNREATDWPVPEEVRKTTPSRDVVDPHFKPDFK